MPPSKPTKRQLAMMELLRQVHWKVWVPDVELAAPRRRAQVLAARRVCFALTARGLAEYRQDGLGGYSFRLTRACREALR